MGTFEIVAQGGSEAEIKEQALVTLAGHTTMC
jgi:hypothetical protein